MNPSPEQEAVYFGLMDEIQRAKAKGDDLESLRQMVRQVNVTPEQREKLLRLIGD